MRGCTHWYCRVSASAVVCPCRMKVYSGTADAVAAVRAGKVVAYITDYTTLKYFASVNIYTDYS